MWLINRQQTTRKGSPNVAVDLVKCIAEVSIFFTQEKSEQGFDKGDVCRYPKN